MAYKLLLKPPGRHSGITVLVFVELEVTIITIYIYIKQAADTMMSERKGLDFIKGVGF